MAAPVLAQVAGFCANANGAFVSPKQAEFFMAKYKGLIEELQSYSFGEFNGCTRTTETVVVFTLDGIQSVKVEGATTKIMFDKATGVNLYAINKAKREENAIIAAAAKISAAQERAAMVAARKEALAAEIDAEITALKGVAAVVAPEVVNSILAVIANLEAGKAAKIAAIV